MEDQKIENGKSLVQNTADKRIKLKWKLLSNKIGVIPLILLSFSLVTVLFLYSPLSSRDSSNAGGLVC